jgi:hypothetical protein
VGVYRVEDDTAKLVVDQIAQRSRGYCRSRERVESAPVDIVAAGTVVAGERPKRAHE